MSDLIRFIQVVAAHPNHPRMIHFPIVLSYLGVLVVFLAWLRRDAFFERAAFYTMFLLALSTPPVGLVGILENQTRYAGNAPNAMLKIILASLLLLVSAVATFWCWRRPDILNRSPGKYVFALAFVICAGLTTLLGALGGIIVWGA
jgi:uncharacterized membrane protein